MQKFKKYVQIRTAGRIEGHFLLRDISAGTPKSKTQRKNVIQTKLHGTKIKAIMTRHKLKSSKLLTDTIPNKEVTSRIRNAVHLQRIERENGNKFRAMFSTILPYLRFQCLVLSFVGILLYFLRIFSSHGHSELEVFVSWLSDNGAILHPNVILKSYPDYGGYGLSTKSDGGGIQYYEELFRIPDTLILSRDTIVSKMSTNVPKSVKEDDDVVIAMQLMVECALGSESFYAPYLQVLPKEVPRYDLFWVNSIYFRHYVVFNVIQTRLLGRGIIVYVTG